MKKYFTFCVLFMTGLSASSQDALGWKFGVNFSPMFTWMSSSENVDSKGTRMGFDFGLSAEHYFAQRYAYFSGLFLMNVGGRVEGKPGNQSGFHSGAALEPGQEAQLRVKYLSVPIGLKFKTPEYGMLSYYFQTALFPGVRIGGSGSTASTPTSPGATLSTRDYNLITMGLQLGAGTMYSTGDNTYLKLGLSFDYFFIDALRGGLKAHPAGLGLNVGFLF